MADAVPVYPDWRAYLWHVQAAECWRGRLPLSARASILPEDAAADGKFRADVLVIHEAPTYHRHGFVGIDAVTAAFRATLIVHGHQHESYDLQLAAGIWVKDLDKAELFRVTKEMLG